MRANRRYWLPKYLPPSAESAAGISTLSAAGSYPFSSTSRAQYRLPDSHDSPNSRLAGPPETGKGPAASRLQAFVSANVGCGTPKSLAIFSAEVSAGFFARELVEFAVGRAPARDLVWILLTELRFQIERIGGKHLRDQAFCAFPLFECKRQLIASGPSPCGR